MSVSFAPSGQWLKGMAACHSIPVFDIDLTSVLPTWAFPDSFLWKNRWSAGCRLCTLREISYVMMPS